MPTSVPLPTKASGDVFTATMWNNNLRDNINKLLDKGHRVLTVAQFSALSSPEGQKGVVAPDEVYLEVDATNGVLWHLAFETGETTYKWRFLGGPPLYSKVDAYESSASSTFVALTTAGPSVALPRSGDYDIYSQMKWTLGGGTGVIASYDIGGTAAVDGDSIGGSVSKEGSRLNRKTGLGSVTLTSKYRMPGGTASAGMRVLSVTPVRIAHNA